MAPKVDKKQVKEREKVIEDKTFGMKNKNKSSKVQKYIQGMKASASSVPTHKPLAQQEAEAKLKKQEAEKAALLSSIFGIQPVKKKKKVEKIDDGKIDLYTDNREATKEEDTMDKWDQTKLEEVVKTKHAAQDTNKTDIVCKFFLEAVQKSLYGWFWNCPNGEACKYRHALPPGYVLKRNEGPKDDDDEDEIPIEEQVEIERAKLPPGGTPVTEETFMKWLKKKEEEKKKLAEDKEAEKGKKQQVNRNMMSGKELFVMDPSLFVDDDAAASEYEISDHEGQEDPEDELNISHPLYTHDEGEDGSHNEGEEDEEDEDEEDEEEEEEDDN